LAHPLAYFDVEKELAIARAQQAAKEAEAEGAEATSNRPMSKDGKSTIDDGQRVEIATDPVSKQDEVPFGRIIIILPYKAPEAVKRI
jgi:hypothetical protein